MTDPILREQDTRAWNSLRMLALCHARTIEHAGAVDRAKRAIDRALAAAPTWAVMWSGGKDSTAMAHLTAVAFEMLKPGGRLVAICANGPRQQAELRPLATTWEELPDGTFADQGTNVRTVLMTVRA